MPKHGFLTPKAIGNRIKAKGLQKLRWYCQMCNKQCRDENGFKCHTMSESHARQMRLFRENSGKYMGYYSDMFKKGFMEVLRRRGRNRVKANTVYMEYIKDRHHIHMNSTQWESLSSLVVYLSKAGLCEADQTEKGWFVKWKDTDPDRMARRNAADRLDKMKMTAEAVAEKQIQEQVKRAYDLAQKEGGGEENEDSGKKELKRDEKRQDLQFGLATKKISTPAIKVGNKALFDSAASTKKRKKRPKEEKKSTLEMIMEEQEQEKKRKLEKAAAAAVPENIKKENWLFREIIVKVLNKKLAGGKYYKKKAVVLKVRKKFEGEIKMLDSGDVLRIDQEYLETVIPGVKRPVLIVNGSYRGFEAEMVSLDDDPKADQPTVTVKIVAGQYKGKVVKGIDLEDVCKLSN
eukprot:jgi/Bigna1/48674/estExt_Genewise1.C_300090